jgi:hypothetical protein
VQELFSSLPLRLEDDGQDLLIGVFVHDDGFEEFILALEMVVESTQSEFARFAICRMDVA